MRILKSFFLKITRPRFVIGLIILIILSMLIGTLVPQIGDKSPSYFEAWRLGSPRTFYLVNILQLDRVYSSVWFLTLVCIILMALCYSVYSQIIRNSKKMHALPPPPGKWDVITTGPALDCDSLAAYMKKLGYRPDSHPGPNPDDCGRLMIFSKNNVTRWGGAVFHFGLLLIIAAGMIGLAFHKRGFVQIIEGELFSGNHDGFLTRSIGPLQDRFDTTFETRLNAFSRSYWDTDQIKDISSTLALIDNSGSTREETVTVNHPVTFKGIRLYQTLNYGYALSFVMRGPDGGETVAHFMVDAPETRNRPFTGSIGFPHTPYIFDMKFYPDISMNSFYLGRPVLSLKVMNDVSRVVFDALLRPGDVINIEGNLFRFHAIAPWCGLRYVRSFDMSIAYAGFILSSLGATMIFLIPHKQFFLLTEGAALLLHARTNRYKPLFREEVELIKRGLKDLC